MFLESFDKHLKKTTVTIILKLSSLMLEKNYKMSGSAEHLVILLQCVFQESVVLPGKNPRRKKGHNSVKILQMISKFEPDLYFTMIYPFCKFKMKKDAFLQNLLIENQHSAATAYTDMIPSICRASQVTLKTSVRTIINQANSNIVVVFM